ncbi:MAG: App1 family protein [bacterium]|nr:App1 family protein [bacterium]
MTQKKTLILLTLCFAPLLLHGQIESDERVVFFPTYAYFSSKGTLSIAVHGNIHEPEEGSYKRKVILSKLRTMVNADASNSRLFNKRARAFFVDNERNENIEFTLGGTTYSSDDSDANGHFFKNLELPYKSIKKSAGRQGIIPFRAVTPEGDNRVFSGRVQVIGTSGVSVISDLDDTIKISNVLNKTELVKNVFLREYQAVPGMSALYRKWAGRGVRFHYVSGSPWQLYEPLQKFMTGHKFPFGSFHLKYFRLKDRSAIKFVVADQLEYKLNNIREIMNTFPKRKFVLIGDSGEHDAEVYAETAKEYKGRVIAICIRDAGNLAEKREAFKKLFSGIDAVEVKFFKKGRELRGLKL